MFVLRHRATPVCTANCAGCEYGDKNPNPATWCQEGLRSDCYGDDYVGVCCETCARLRGDQTGCEFGDRASWCPADIAEPAWQCYHQQTETTCCETCQRFRTSVQGRSLHVTSPLITALVTLLCPAPNRRGIERCFCLTSDVCLSVAYIGPKSRTERPRKTKNGTEIAHVTPESDTILKVKRSNVKVTRPLYSTRP